MSKKTLPTLAEFDLEQAPDLCPTSRMDVDDGLRRLGTISGELRSFKTLSTINALWTLVWVILSALLPQTFLLPRLNVSTKLLALFSLYPLALAGISLLFLWERRRAEGKLLFEEISDELEWHHRTFKPNADYSQSTPDVPKPRVDFGTRVLLREFLDASNMPFIPGPFGAAGYLAFYIGCMILGTVMISIVR